MVQAGAWPDSAALASALLVKVNLLHTACIGKGKGKPLTYLLARAQGLLVRANSTSKQEVARSTRAPGSSTGLVAFKCHLGWKPSSSMASVTVQLTQYLLEPGTGRHVKCEEFDA